MLEVGSTVIYRNHVCVVAEVHERYYEDQDYYELRTVFEGSLKFYLPVSLEGPSVVRPVMTRQEAMRLIGEIPSIGAIDGDGIDLAGAAGARTAHSLVERQIKDEYVRRLSECSPRELVVVVKSAYERTRDRESAGKHAMSVDKQFLSLAEKLLCDELAVSLDMPRDEVPGFLREKVSKLAGA